MKETITSVKSELGSKLAEMNGRIDEIQAAYAKSSEFCSQQTTMIVNEIRKLNSELQSMQSRIDSLAAKPSGSRRSKQQVLYTPYKMENPQQFDPKESGKLWQAFLYIHRTLDGTLAAKYPKPEDGGEYPDLSSLQVYVQGTKLDRKIRVTVRPAMLRVNVNKQNLEALTHAQLKSVYGVEDPKTATREQWFDALARALSSSEGKALLAVVRMKKNN